MAIYLTIGLFLFLNNNLIDSKIQDTNCRWKFVKESLTFLPFEYYSKLIPVYIMYENKQCKVFVSMNETYKSFKEFSGIKNYKKFDNYLLTNILRNNSFQVDSSFYYKYCFSNMVIPEKNDFIDSLIMNDFELFIGTYSNLQNVECESINDTIKYSFDILYSLNYFIETGDQMRLRKYNCD